MSEQKNIDSVYPLSPVQQGMLFHTLLAPKSGVYFNQILYTLTGCLQTLAMQRAWQEVVDRHGSLRTLFVWEAREKPLQVVRRRVTLPWEELDWRGLSADEQDTKRAAFLHADRVCGFELTQAPLMRLALIRLGENHHELIWSHHHLLIEGWSSFLVLKDVMAIYQAISEGQDYRLEPVRPYRDYINWLQRQDPSKAEGFWREALKGFAAPTPLLGSPRVEGQEVRDYEFAEQIGSTPPSLTAALKSFARQNDLTLSTIVQGAWAILLGRYSGETDVVFGSTVSGRSAELVGIESMVGLFINSVPVRAQFSPQIATLAWLKDFQDKLVEVRQFEHSPLVDVQGWSEVPRGQPLFESLVVFENHPVDASVWGQDGTLQISNMRVVAPTNYPLAIVVVPGMELSIRVRYDSRRFDGAAISRILGPFNTLLEGIVANPGGRLAELPMLTEAERQQVLYEWNATAVDYPEDRCLHQLFEEQVERAPEALAVVFEDTQLTYRQLNERSNQLARYLQGLGVGPDTLVAICLERSLEMVVGLLGILKAGGAYVPLDPSYPSERLAFMLSDSQARVLLTRQSLAGVLPAGAAQAVYVDTRWAVIAQHAAGNLETPVRPDQLVYVIYTSGSTGRPKGVCGEHRATLNRLRWMWQQYPFVAGERCCQKTVLSFVDSVWEIFGPLLQGVATVLIAEPVVKDPRQLVAALTEGEVTRIVLVPSLLQALLDEYADLGAQLPRLAHWTSSGEALARDLAERFFERLPGRVLLNLYGSSEVAADATWFEVTPNARPGPVPIGRPIANTQIYILDPYLQPAPIGVPGELHIGGIGLARGYHNRPELTAEKFISNPFRREHGARLYKTGDLVRYLPDGAIEYLGRLDHQVKIRGFRIELGEIESVLAAHPGVREGVALVREDETGDKRLVAYYTAAGGDEPGAEALRAHLAAGLPEYMVPAAYVRLEALPLTPNGKLDRKALPAPELGRASFAAGYVAPRTPVEEALAEIWGRVLGLTQVGVHDNFFDLGGHSLRALRLLVEVKKSFDYNLSVSIFFQDPTIAGTARAIEEEKQAASEPQLIPLKPGNSSETVFLLQAGVGVCRLARFLNAGQAVFATHVPWQTDLFRDSAARRGADLLSVENLAAPHVALIRPHLHSGHVLLAGYSFGGLLAFEVAHQLQREGIRVEMILLLDALVRAPPWWQRLGMRARRFLRKRPSASWTRIRATMTPRAAARTANKFLAAELEQIRFLSGEVPQRTLAVYGSASRKYRHRRLDCRAVLFQCQDNLYARYATYSQRVWSGLFARGLEIVRIPGDHTSLLRDPDIKVLGPRINDVLKQFRARKAAELESNFGDGHQDRAA